MANVETRRNELFLRMGAASEHIFYEERLARQLVYFIEIWARDSSRRGASKTFERVEDFRRRACYLKCYC